MGLSNPRINFGVHSLTPYNRSTGEFYGILKVLGGSSLQLTGELIKLNGGSLKYPWAIEEGYTTAELAIKPKEYPDFLFELFLGKAPTLTDTPDTDGTFTTPENKTGTSVIDASTGIASVEVIPSTGAPNLKFGKYVVKAASSTTVDVYASTDVDFNRGSNHEFSNDLLLVATGLTITASTPTTIAALGFQFTGGSGTIGMTTGDTAVFELVPPFTKKMEVTIGGTSDTFPEFGAIIMAKQRSNQEMFEIDAFRCKASGMPLGFEANTFAEGEIKAELFYDSSKNGIFKARHVTPS